MRKFQNINLVKHKTALERLKELGTVVKISTDSPYFINHAEHIYLVHFGLVDVFYMRRSGEGRILSPRVHLQSIERNQMLMPVGSPLPDGTQIDLLAVSNRAELLLIDKAVFFSVPESKKKNGWLRFKLRCFECKLMIINCAVD